ncbi:MAG: formylmethanofuran dehydrogenase subunit C [Gammaproteobacteria bacterium]
MITLRLDTVLEGPLDLTGVTPDALAGLSPERLRRHKVPYGRRAVALGDLFSLRGSAMEGAFRFTAVTPHVHGLGAGMREGTLHLEGDCGNLLGAGMRGGEIRLDGDAGDLAGANMRGGLLRIAGSAGAFLGGGLPGSTSGMRGGTILVARHAGARTADRLRRGTIVVGGDAGPGCAAQMIAGTVVVLGQVGAHCALGMRRGSLLVRAPGFRVPGTFVNTGEYALSFVTLLTGYVGALDTTLARRLRAFRAVQRWVGDRGCDGLGEILVARA